METHSCVCVYSSYIYLNVNSLVFYVVALFGGRKEERAEHNTLVRVCSGSLA